MVLLSALILAPAQFYYQLDPDRGLKITFNGVPVTRGSWFQFHDAGWSKDYLSSNGIEPTISRPDPNTMSATWTSGDGLAIAKETFTRDQQALHVHYSFDWGGDTPVKVELAAGTLWGPAVEAGTLMNNGKPTRTLATTAYHSQSWDDRRFGPDSTLYSLQAPFGNVQVKSSVPLTFLDGRSDFHQDWASGNDLIWVGAEDVVVEKGKTTTVDVDWQFTAPDEASGQETTAVSKLTTLADPAAYSVPERRPPLIPRPRASILDWDHPVEISGKWTFPAGRFRFFDEFETSLARRFVLPTAGPAVNMDGGVSKLGLTPGAYRITIKPEGVSVVGQKDEGFRYGLQRVAQLAFARGGKLYLPTGTLFDEPVNTFRGVHLFVGPDAPEFQKKLVERVLLPLGMNQVVLQCERSAWKSLPGIATSESMPLDKLQSLFTMWRDHGFETTPLIESFGHDEWLFANGKNLDIALNPKVPYAVDPRKPETKELLGKLWDEVITLLHPSTIHFGLDEVDMEGFPGDHRLMTELWRTQMGVLSDIAKSHNVGMMFWGDELLAPGEAADAMNAPTNEDAVERRSSVPQGAMIADWHYLSDPNPAKFTPSLKKFSELGFKPIASTWYQPDNIRGFDLAAISGGFGTLQTTWAGYLSSEDAMISHIQEFNALVLAADYAWSGRQDEIKELDYDFADVFRRMYFGQPESLATEHGECYSVGDGKAVRIGDVDFRFGQTIQLRSKARPAENQAAMVAEIPLHLTAKHLAIAVSSLLPANENEKIGDIQVVFENGKSVLQPLLYGQHVRALNDSRACLYSERHSGASAFVFDFGAKGAPIVAVRVLQSNQFSGLQVLALTTY